MKAAERAVFTIRQGDDWSRTWTHTSGTATYSGTLLVQIRAGTDSGAVLVASSETVDTEAPIDLTGTDLGAGTIAMAVVAADTVGLDPHGTFTIEAECEVDGLLTTILSHQLWVIPQVAVQP